MGLLCFLALHRIIHPSLLFCSPFPFLCIPLPPPPVISPSLLFRSFDPRHPLPSSSFPLLKMHYYAPSSAPSFPFPSFPLCCFVARRSFSFLLPPPLPSPSSSVRSVPIDLIRSHIYLASILIITVIHCFCNSDHFLFFRFVFFF